MSNEQILLRVVGIQVPESICRLSACPGVKVMGPVKDVAREHKSARGIVILLCAGSRTCIKILKEFSLSVSLASTGLRTAGLYVTYEGCLRIADTLAEFASACFRLIEGDLLTENLADSTDQRLVSHHSLDRA
jgi:hypothetical protein